MDLKPWECQVCVTCYSDPDKRPRTLPCGHTFCTPCLHTLMLLPPLHCPSCRASHTLTSTNRLPINYDLESVAQTMNKMSSMARPDATPITQSETGHNELDGIRGACGKDQVKIDDAKPNSRPNESSNIEETKPAQKPVPAALLKDRVPGLSKKLRASLAEQRHGLQERIRACQEVQEELNQYRSSLTAWTQQHQDLIQGLTELQQENQHALQHLLKEDDRVGLMQEEGQEDIKQLTAMIATLDAVTTPQEAFVVTNDADCYSEVAEEWMERAQRHFPDPSPVQQAAQIISVTAAALSKRQSEPIAPVQLPDPALGMMQKVRIITDSVTSAHTARKEKSTQCDYRAASSTTALTSHMTSSFTPSPNSTPDNGRTPSPNSSKDLKSSLSLNISNTDSTFNPAPKPDHSSQASTHSPTLKSLTRKKLPVPAPRSIPVPKTPSTPDTDPISTASTNITSKPPSSDSRVPSNPSESSPSPAPTSNPTQSSTCCSTDNLYVDAGVGANSITVEEIREMDDGVRELVQNGSVYAVRKIRGRMHSSRLTLKNNQVYLHCLQDQPPPQDAVTLPIGETVDGLKMPASSRAFLELSWAGQRRGTVNIVLKYSLPLAKQFILLCTGQLGHSYVSTNFLSVGNKGQPGEYVIGGDYEYNDGTGGAHLLPTCSGMYRKSEKAGAVLGWHTLGGNKSAQFAIVTRDGMEGTWKRYTNVYGEVESGIQLLRRAVQYFNVSDVEIIDCGVVLSA